MCWHLRQDGFVSSHFTRRLLQVLHPFLLLLWYLRLPVEDLEIFLVEALAGCFPEEESEVEMDVEEAEAEAEEEDNEKDPFSGETL